MGNTALWVTLTELDLACPKPFQMSEVPFFLIHTSFVNVELRGG